MASAKDALLGCLLTKTIGVDTSSIVDNFNDKLVAFLKGLQQKIAHRSLTGCKSRFWSFDTMVNGISNDVHQGITQVIQYRLVELGIFADHHQVNFFAENSRSIANDTLKFLKRRFHWKHAQTHREILDIFGDLTELVYGFTNQVGVLKECSLLAKNGLQDDHLAYKVHEFFEARERNANAVFGSPCGLCWNTLLNFFHGGFCRRYNWRRD